MMKKAKARTRLSSAERRQMIIHEASALFARKGFYGVTTKEIAAACGVSEPLLYQHFKTKEELYNELQLLCKGQTGAAKKLLARREASTETLCFFVYMLTSMIPLARIPGQAKSDPEIQILTRLAGYSLLEEGRFMKTLLRDCIGSLFDEWVSSYKAASRSGDLLLPAADNAQLLIAYELMIGTAWFHLQPLKAVSELHDSKDYLEKVSLFILRGMGLSDKALRKNFQPKKWAAEFKTVLDGGA